MTIDSDDSKRLVDAIGHAVANKKQLSIVGQGTKSRYAHSTSGDALQVCDHVGIIEYQPDELTISVRAGTPIREIADILAANDQSLACDPPRFMGGGTIGGAVACGLSGPGRPWYGNVRDAVLGVEMVNGLGERLRFGGKVMKNVAGFDVSRLLVGSLGVFGLILSVNLRIQPKPQIERTLVTDTDWDEAWRVMCGAIAKPSPVTATCYCSGSLHLRLSGNRASVADASSILPSGHETDNNVWEQLRDHTHAFFNQEGQLRRSWYGRGTKAQVSEDENVLVEWAGAQLWSFGQDSTSVALDANTDREPFDRSVASPPSESKYVKRLRRAFDPHRLLNSDVRL